jgi:pyruvate dehydrogenase E2 component (dihydrolipoamide acetyltransferase)
VSQGIESLTMPKWGLTMTHGTVTEWLVDEGDEIAIGDEVCEVETDKATSPVEAQVGGTLRRRVVAEGDVVGVGGVLAVLAPAAVSDDEIQAFIDSIPESAPEDFADENGQPRSSTIHGPRGDLHVVQQGEGEETVLLLHGFGGDAQNWRFIMADLAQAHAVVAMDLPGHGASTKSVGDGALDGFVSDVVALMSQLEIDRAHVVGHSLGGLIAAHFAAAHPDRVLSLTLVAPAGLGAPVNSEFLDGFVAASSRREVKAVLRALFATEDLVSRPLIEEVLRYKRLEGVPEALATIRDANFSDDVPTLAPDLGTLDIPVLVVWGAQDAVISSELAGAASASARLEIIPTAGHSPHVEEPGEVRRILSGFLGNLAER